MLKDLDPLLHSQLRLAVVSILMAVEEAEYIEANRTLDGKRTRTICKMTNKGRKAFAEYIDALKDYLNVGHF